MSDKSNFQESFKMGASMGRFLGFWTVLLILTLDASNGKDILDVTVPLIEAYTNTLLK